MEYFMGETFDKEKNKPYKKLDAAEKAAGKAKAAVFDENGEVVKDFREKIETAAEPPQTATDDSQEQQPADSTDQEGQEQQATMTGKANEEVKAAEKAVTENIDGVPAVRIKGKIRRVFNGSIRIRKAPSWSNDAVRGVTAFAEKIVTHMMEVDGKPMYKTLDGYYISGDPKLVEYIEE